MKIPQIRMQSEMARIRIEQTPAQLDMKLGSGKLSIEQPSAEMTIKSHKGKLTIDQSQAWEEHNLMSTIRLNENHAKEGRQAIQEGIARRAEQGVELIKIETGVNTIAEQAIQNGHPQMKQLSIKYVPSSYQSIKIHYEPGDVEIHVEQRKPIIDSEMNEPEFTYHRGNVDILMEQYAELQIDYIDLYA